MESEKKNSKEEPYYVLERIQRGLAGYISYLAACEMNKSFSEYVLYEPILRILTAQGYAVESEYPIPIPKVNPSKGGDHRRIDFVAFSNDFVFALEVKWINEKGVDIDSDIEKLNFFLDKEWKPFLCIFGRKSHFKSFQTPYGFQEVGKFVCADLFRTKYGCKIYELSEQIEVKNIAILPKDLIGKSSIDTKRITKKAAARK